VRERNVRGREVGVYDMTTLRPYEKHVCPMSVTVLPSTETKLTFCMGAERASLLQQHLHLWVPIEVDEAGPVAPSDMVHAVLLKHSEM